mmetsp:Transcript_21705/g.33432  ORF Transcript_21705/g.33432 Transcript_21705/m.33432 type:complete len:99 (-) Transcript_21705:42-338(-)
MAVDEISNNQYKQMFQESLPAIFQFIEASMKLDFNNLKIVKMVVGLVGDIATSFCEVPNLKAMCQQSYIEQGIMKMQSSGDPETKEAAQFALAAINKL